LKKIKWDVTGKKIKYFDPELSYEITGYRPIAQDKKFNPDWFREAAIEKDKTGKYTPLIRNTVSWGKFWIEERRRCIDGYEVNGYRITGHHYFFLNYYPIPSIIEVNGKKRREVTFPRFIDVQYEYFHYLDLCTHLNKDACLLKARGLGFSHIAAAIGVNIYNHTRDSRSMFTAFDEDYLIKEGVLSKAWEALDYLNQGTDGAFKHLRQKINSNFHKRASKVDKSGEELNSSWKSEIIGQVVDEPRKLRGARCEVVFFEEGGVYRNLIDAFIKAEALVEVLGDKFGLRVVWGTGGEGGAFIEGLEKIYLSPESYNILPLRHNHTTTKEYVYTSFFIPAYRMVAEFMDYRGITDEIKAREYYDAKRITYKNKPLDLAMHVAEYCYTAEEALSQRGNTIFNKAKLLAQEVEVKINKTTPAPEVGRLEWEYIDNTKKVKGVKFIPDPSGKVLIVEHPLKENGASVENLYVSGIDSIDAGAEATVVGDDGSKFCQVVKKRTYGLSGDKYVCLYLDRPDDERDCYDTSLKILHYYSCLANLEDTKRSIIGYFRDRGQYWRLIKRPTIATASAEAKQRSNLIGTPGSTKIIHHQNDLTKAYVEDFSQNIYFEIMLQQLLNYSFENKSKFDIVAAMGMAEIYDEDITGVTPIPSTKLDDEWVDVGYYTDSSGIRRYGPIPKNLNIHNLSKSPEAPIKFVDLLENKIEYEW